VKTTKVSSEKSTTHAAGALSPVSIQTQSLALRALRKRKPQETQALRPSIPIGWRLRWILWMLDSVHCIS